MDFNLTESEKDILLLTAREQIRSELRGQKPNYPASTENLKQICGAFVTLHKEGMLRGCVGNIIGRMPLISTIREMAHASAFEDPRFPPVSSDEFSEIDIEISVLSPLKKITDVSEIITGTHGIFMKRGFSSGVLLPQVAVEQNWDRTTFLQHTCMKAGLPADAWQDEKTQIEIFSAIIFSEKK